ncbi:MAG: formyl transferase [Candidatus Cloacimonetes bacterium]|nr:formyl transferase [Candidatus Cloacimonadota bacterium]
MNIYILTQEDAFYIPKLLKVFFDKKPKNADIVGGAIIQGEISGNNVIQYYNFLGFSAFVNTAFHFTLYKIMDALDKLFKFRKSYSVSGFLSKQKIDLEFPKKINCKSFREILIEKKVDLIISIACPQKIKQRLLNLPPEGCINIHGALLPKYRGKLPSFWVLANGESKTGVSVHYMNKELDDGPIIIQKEVSINDDDTLHSLIMKSKVNFGALALAEAVSLILQDKVVTQKNDSTKATYYSFPTTDAVKEFRKKGRKFR